MIAVPPQDFSGKLYAPARQPHRCGDNVAGNAKGGGRGNEHDVHGYLQGFS
jgi:hypothetical protein